MYYYRARYFNATAHRFVSEDPAGLLGGSPNLYVYLGNRPLNFVDPLGLFNILAGGGFSAVGITGVEASGGLFANPGFFGQNADIGTFAAVGIGTGLNISADRFVGYIKGGPENVKGETFNTNITIERLSITIFKDPKTGEILGGTVGLGPGATRFGLSETYSITRTLTARDLLCAIFGNCGSGDVLSGRKPK